MLSTKVIAEFKLKDSPNNVQVDKEARQIVLDKVHAFLSVILANCETLKAVSRRKTYKLIDVVNASAQALRDTEVNVGAFLSTVLGTPVPNKAIYTKDDLTSTEGMYKLEHTEKGPQKRVKTLNTLRISRIESMFSTTQKAERHANVFLSRASDYVALEILMTASRNARSKGKKRIVKAYISAIGSDRAPAAAADGPVEMDVDDGPVPTPPPELLDENSDALPVVPDDLCEPAPPPPSKKSKKRKLQ